MSTPETKPPLLNDPPPAAHHPLLLPALAMIVGLLLGRWTNLPAWLWLIPSVIALAVLAFSLRRTAGQHSRSGTVAALIMVVLLGAAWITVRTQPRTGDIGQLALPAGRLVTLEGVLVESPRQSRHPDNPLLPGGGTFAGGELQNFTKAPEGEGGTAPGVSNPSSSRKKPDDRLSSTMTLETEAVVVDDCRYPVNGRVRVTISQPLPPLDQRPRTGDRLKVVGLLYGFSSPQNPGQADMEEVYRGRGIRAALSTKFWAAAQWHRGPWWSAYVWMGQIRHQLHQAMPSQGAADYPNAQRMMPALLLGDLPELLESEQQSFVRAGVVHYLAVSGGHVVLFCGGLLLLVRLFLVGPRMRAVIVIFFVVAYTLALELQPSVTRAAIFFILLSIGWLLGRRRDLLNTLAASAIIVLAINPADLFNAGFQLSFLAVLGLMVTCPRLRDRLFPGRQWHRIAEFSASQKMVYRWRYLAEDFVSTCITASLFTIPLTAWHFHLVSPVGVLGTIVVFPLVTALMFVGAAATLIGMVPGLPTGPGYWSVDLLSRWLDAVVRYLGDLPGSHFYLREFDWPWVAIAFILLLAWTFRRPLGLSLPRLALALLVGVAAYLWLGVPRGPSDEVRITTLAVGSGNAVLVQAPGGYNLLVDCGSSLLAERTGQSVTVPALWKLGCGHLDAVVLTHADADHVKDLPAIVPFIPVERVYISRHFNTPEKTYDDRVLAWLQREKTEVVPLQTGDLIPAPPGVEIRVLSPPAEMPATGETNPGSVVLRVAYRGRAMILTADAPPEQLAAMAARPVEIAADVVLLPHHGQQSAEILDFLKGSQASAAVMSVGRYRAVHQQTKFDWPVDMKLYRTYLDGAVTVHLGSPGDRVETFATIRDSRKP